jgi:hypothetical protein
MALTLGHQSSAANASARFLPDEGWSRHLLHLLVFSGAATVIAGSYTTWATFYAGLIERSGVSGHGKYFIGLAVASLLATLVPSIPGIWRGLRWLAVPAGITIGSVAFRDLRNLDALIGDPATGFYLPGRGDGLFIVIVGGAIIALAPIARPAARVARFDVVRTAVALVAVAGVAMLVPGLYGEYYLHVANGHAHGHTDALNSAHLLTAAGALMVLAASHAALVMLARSRVGRRAAVTRRAQTAEAAR